MHELRCRQLDGVGCGRQLGIAVGQGAEFESGWAPDADAVTVRVAEGEPARIDLVAVLLGHHIRYVLVDHATTVA